MYKNGWLALAIAISTQAFACSSEMSQGGDGVVEPCASSPDPVALVTSDVRIRGVALDENYVYWTTGTYVADGLPSGGTVMRVALGGGSPETLASDQGLPTDIVVDAHNVYWIDQFYRQVVSVPLSGGSPVALVTAGQASALAIDASYAYWLNFDDRRSMVMKAPLAGGPAIEVAPTQTYMGTLAVDADSVYWTDNDRNGGARMMKVPLSGGPATTLLATTADSQYGAGDMFHLDATSVYLGGILRPVIGELDSNYGSAVFKIPVAGGAPTLLASGTASAPAVVVVATDVYWSNGSTLMKVPRDGGAASVVASNLSEYSRLFNNGVKVCWTTDEFPLYALRCLDTCN